MATYDALQTAQQTAAMLSSMPQDGLPIPTASTGMPQHENRNSEAKMFVGGIPPSATEESFREFCSQWGNITDIRLMIDKMTGRPRGFGFVTYADSSSVKHCLASGNYKEFEGKTVEFKCTADNPAPTQTTPEAQGLKLFVGGLPPTATQDMVEGYFGKFGSIRECNVLYDQQTQQCRGFGFVTFEEASSVTQAIQEYNDHYIEGKWVEVKQCQPRGAKGTGKGGKGKGDFMGGKGKGKGYGDSDGKGFGKGYGSGGGYQSYGGGDSYQQQGGYHSQGGGMGGGGYSQPPSQGYSSGGYHSQGYSQPPQQQYSQPPQHQYAQPPQQGYQSPGYQAGATQYSQASAQGYAAQGYSAPPANGYSPGYSQPPTRTSPY